MSDILSNEELIRMDDLLKQARGILMVANDMLRQGGAEDQELITVTLSQLWVAQIHRWDGDPSDPGSVSILGVGDAAHMADILQKQNERRHESRRFRPLNFLFEEDYDEDFHREDAEKDALLHPWDFDWTDAQSEDDLRDRRDVISFQRVKVPEYSP